MSEPKTIRKGQLAIWGGECSEATVLTLLQNWPGLAEMPYRIWEYTDEIKFEKDGQLPASFQWLERARLFGEGGDLTLRRDGEKFHWWFVGLPGIPLPDILPVDLEEIKKKAKNFWDHDPQACFNEETATMLLWGNRPENNNLFWDDRVAGANLSYEKMVAGPAERVEIEYVTYSRAGRLEFVWLRELIGQEV